MIRAVDGNPCVLFVDDEEMTRKTFERIASSEFPILLAADVAEAIETLKQRGDEIGVLLTDQRMPGGLGVELLEYARDQNPGIVRMLTTAYSELEDAIAAVNRGEIIRYIEKPWNNIDALLIDLRVAMRLHLLERSNEELMAEKMFAKARGARIERLQVLAALASAQPDPSVGVIALEDMLRGLSDLRADHETEDQTAAAELYSGPVNEAKNAVLLASRFSQSLSTNTGDSWQDLSSISVTGGAASQAVPELLSGKGGELMARAEALLGTAGTQVNIESTDKGLAVSFSSDSGSSMALNYWVNIGSDENSIFAIADLLKLYVIAYSSNAEINIGFDAEGALAAINVLFSNQKQGSAPRTQDGDWLEDMVILFS